MFEDIEWSTNSVFEKTVNRITQNNLCHKTLEELIDLDIKEDLLKWYKINKNNSDDKLVEFISELKL